ncbi:MAG: ATP-binding cassette domain-containing protein, partial [Dehalococcoidia bacterium]|nr:ATP-binding cassette domain-containing protein [Dehalococcoidia bacterium]
MSALLEVVGLSAGYGGVQIVHEASISVSQGEIVTIIGPNGAGKSTFLKAIFGAIRPTAGRVMLDGRDVSGLSANQMVAAGAGFVPQTENVFPSLTIRENLEMGAYRRKGGVNERIDELLARF